MKNIISPERDFTLIEAKQRIGSEFAALKLVSSIRTVGERVVVAYAALTNSDLTRIVLGTGKGYLEEAQVGARYDALEHYLSDYRNFESDVEYQPAAWFARTRTGFFFDDSVLDLVARQSDATMACRIYTCPAGLLKFPYPLALSSPNYPDHPLPGDDFDYKTLRRYCSNSGTAIGANYNEAVIHAANECIERDALSLFLLTHFYYRQDIPLQRLTRPLNDRIGVLWGEVERELGAEVVVIDISTEFAVKTYLAFARTTSTHPHVFGSGASLDARHAVRRALTKLAQLHLGVADAEIKEEICKADRHLSLFPRLQRCLRLDVGYLLDEVRHRHVALPALEKLPTLAKQVRLIACDLQRHCRALGVCTIYSSELGTTLVNVVIPGLERFFIVANGNVVVPLERGRRLQRRPQTHVSHSEKYV